MKYLLAAVLLLGTVGCVTPTPGEPKAIDVTEAPVRGLHFGSTSVKHHDQVFISARPAKDAFKAASAAGVALVINLQERHEIKGDDASLARQVGVSYLHIPVSSRGSFQKTAFEQISAAVEKANGPVWVYCASANRAGAWYAAHLMLKRHLDQDEALAIARDVGMTRPEFQDRVLDYVNKQNAKP